jgi:hypothetical protein
VIANCENKWVSDRILKHLRHKNGENSGPNPTTSIYNASVVKIYSVTNSMALFEE